ncbi:MAG: TPM domain-containing protein [Bdellovibrionia bacterium]
MIKAIAEAEQITTAQIRVYLSKKWWERNPLKRAQRLFDELQWLDPSLKCSVLFYIHLKKKKFAILSGEEIEAKTPDAWLGELAEQLRANLQATESERAIALTIQSASKLLSQLFPRSKKPKES